MNAQRNNSSAFLTLLPLTFKQGNHCNYSNHDNRDNKRSLEIYQLLMFAETHAGLQVNFKILLSDFNKNWKNWLNFNTIFQGHIWGNSIEWLSSLSMRSKKRMDGKSGFDRSSTRMRTRLKIMHRIRVRIYTLKFGQKLLISYGCKNKY